MLKLREERLEGLFDKTKAQLKELSKDQAKYKKLLENLLLQGLLDLVERRRPGRQEHGPTAGGDRLEQSFIDFADAVIFAHDVAVRDKDRFAGKPVIESGVKRADRKSVV